MEMLMESSWTGSAKFERARSLSPQAVQALPPPLVRELSDSFQVFDRNGDGKISEEELAAVLRSLGERVSDAEIATLMKEVDANGDGYIDLHEFIELNTRPIRSSNIDACSPDQEDSRDSNDSHEALASAFDVFDADKNGFISADELRRVLVAFGDAEVSLDECRRMIQCVDEDGDHMVNFREFVALMSGSLMH